MSKKEPVKGTYCLLIHLKDDSNVIIGKLGEKYFCKGYYVYIGSALNSLEKRVQRHIKSDKKLHWHIDYLLNCKEAEIIDVIYTISKDRWECKIASEINSNSINVVDFGCSDCKCDSHLFYFKRFIDSENSCINALTKLNLNVNNLENLEKKL